MLNNSCKRSLRLNKKKYDTEMGSYFPKQYNSDADGFGAWTNKNEFENFYSDNEMGSWFEDIKASVDTSIQSTIDKAEAQVTAVAGDKFTQKIGDALEKQKDSLVSKATDIATAKAGQLINTKENQDTAITSGVQAAAAQISQTLIDVKDTFATSGISGLFSKYPIPFYVTGGVTSLVLLRFILGGKKKVYMQKATNPLKGLSKSQKSEVKSFIKSCKI